MAHPLESSVLFKGLARELKRTVGSGAQAENDQTKTKKTELHQNQVLPYTGITLELGYTRKALRVTWKEPRGRDSTDLASNLPFGRPNPSQIDVFRVSGQTRKLSHLRHDPSSGPAPVMEKLRTPRLAWAYLQDPTNA